MMGCKSKGLLVLRLAAGIIFLMHGWGKLTGNPSIEMFSGMLGSMGVPAAMFFAWVVALVEFFGGLSLILGIFTRPFAILLAIDMLVAFFGAKHAMFPAGDIDFMLLGTSIAIALMGSGRFSVAGMMMKGKHGGECKGGECKGSKGGECKGGECKGEMKK
jgi:putative oxidoreductase